MTAQGRVHTYGDNVDTDVIIPARYLNTSSHEELAAHCMEDIDKDFVSRVRPGDILVARKNFGCGSSREHAPIAIKASGISCVIASTFARIFYRNAINIGLAILECSGYSGRGRGQGGFRHRPHHQSDHRENLPGRAFPALYSEYYSKRRPSRLYPGSAVISAVAHIPGGNIPSGMCAVRDKIAAVKCRKIITDRSVVNFHAKKRKLS